MFDTQLERNIKEYIIRKTFGNNALRISKRVALLDYCTKFFMMYDLELLIVKDSSQFTIRLDEMTNELLSLFPIQAKKYWGTSRKAVNLFLRDIFLNHHLNKWYQMDNIAEYLETPIEAKITKLLKNNNQNFRINIPPIYSITPIINDQYQKEALKIAKDRGIARLYLEFIC